MNRKSIIQGILMKGGHMRKDSTKIQPKNPVAAQAKSAKSSSYRARSIIADISGSLAEYKQSEQARYNERLVGQVKDTIQNVLILQDTYKDKHPPLPPLPPQPSPQPSWAPRLSFPEVHLPEIPFVELRPLTISASAHPPYPGSPEIETRPAYYLAGPESPDFYSFYWETVPAKGTIEAGLATGEYSQYVYPPQELPPDADVCTSYLSKHMGYLFLDLLPAHDKPRLLRIDAFVKVPEPSVKLVPTVDGPSGVVGVIGRISLLTSGSLGYVPTSYLFSRGLAFRGLGGAVEFIPVPAQITGVNIMPPNTTYTYVEVELRLSVFREFAENGKPASHGLACIDFTRSPSNHSQLLYWEAGAGPIYVERLDLTAYPL
jgi:hypothetical protein